MKKIKDFRRRTLYELSNAILPMDTLDHIPWADQNEVFAELAEVARLDRLTPEERTAYEESCACLAEYGQKAD
ncbi:MAG: hypothetical protein IKY83_09050 [Proteobacteria bacterium]|nr:hypothetical protein [Pseudomonadota bacterium]